MPVLSLCIREITSLYKNKRFDVVVESAVITNLDTLSASLNADLQCSFGGVAQNNGDLMYLSPVILPPFKENRFNLTERNYPVEIPCPISYQFVLQLETPAGFEVDELPEYLNMELQERVEVFSLSSNHYSYKSLSSSGRK